MLPESGGTNQKRQKLFGQEVREDQHDAVGVKLRVFCRKEMRELLSELASEPGSEEEEDDKSRGHWELQSPSSVPDSEDDKEARGWTGSFDRNI